MRPRPQALLAHLPAYVPGQSRLGGRGRAHKLSSNENPFGPSPKARRAYLDAVSSLARYPDGSATSLREALARAARVTAARIVCGHGSGELLHLLARAYLAPGKEALQSQYSFSLYELATRLCGARMVSLPAPNRCPDLAALAKRAGRNTALIFLANPNNPTGSYTRLADLRAWHKTLPPHVLLVLDCAYAEYLPRGELAPLYTWAARQNNVAVLRSFSKAYGLAGLRLGWVYAPRATADVLHRIREPFNVSAPAAAAAQAALKDKAHLRKTVEHVLVWRARLVRELSALGWEASAGEGNFFLLHLGARKKAALGALERAKIIVRRLESYGLPGWVRVSVGSAAANRELLRALASLKTSLKRR